MPDLTSGTEVLAIDHPPTGDDYDPTSISNITSENFIPGSPVVAATILGPTAGQILAVVGGSARADDRTHMTVELRLDNASGAIIEHPQVTEHGYGSARSQANFQYGCRATVIDALEQGQTYYGQFEYRKPPAESGTTGDIGSRSLALIPLPFHWQTGLVGAPYLAADGTGGTLAKPPPPAETAVSTDSLTQLANTLFSAGTPEVGVPFKAPSSGMVLVIVGAGAQDNGGDNTVMVAPAIFEGNDAQANPRVDPDDVADFQAHGWSTMDGAAAFMYSCRATIVELDAGDPHYARVEHAVDGGATADLTVRDISVIPVPASARWAQDGTNLLQISSSSFIDGTPEVGVAFVVPPSGRVLVIVGGGARDDTNDDRVFLAPQIHEGTDDSGSVLLAAAEGEHTWSSIGESTKMMYGSRLSVVDLIALGADPGDDVYAKVMHAAYDNGGSSSGTADLTIRDIGVIPIT